ncbi:MAG: MoaD/ThiS family protein [Gammaproteobacteria bacterium]|jgi:molybdopterin converting factor small subunit
MGNPTATLKLYASLSEFLPSGAVDNKAQIEVGDSDSIAVIIEKFNLPDRLVHLVLVNGVYIEPEDRPSRILAPGEVLAIWPPVAGG